MKTVRIISACLFLGLGTAAGAESPTPVTLEPINHTPAELVVNGPGGSGSYSPADLEAMGAYRLVTTTPWRDVEATFEGVMLSDLLKKHGLSNVSALRVTAENDFEVVIPRSTWENAPVMIATRVNGKPHSRRERGPLQFVMPMDLYEANGDISEGHWVWMAARIEPAD